jgi:hypothetical protein
MHYNNSMPDDDDVLLVSIFRKASQHLSRLSTAEFLEAHQDEIPQTCRLLKFLGLIEPAPDSMVGFKPTVRLIHLLGERLGRRTDYCKSPVTEMDRTFAASLGQIAGGDCSYFWYYVLAALGLLKIAKGGYAPTSLIHNLVLERLARQLSTGE